MEQIISNLKKHWIVTFSIMLVAIVSSTWVCFKETRLEPLNEKVEYQKLLLEEESNKRLMLEKKLNNIEKNTINTSDLKNVVGQVAQEVKKRHNESNQEILNYQIKEKDDTITTDLYINDMDMLHTNYYKIGKYSINDAKNKAAFFDAISFFLLSINKIYKNKNLLLEAKFIGSADNILNNKIIGKYQGEYGTIAQTIILNGEKQNIFIEQNTPITNYQLAFLRAYSVYDAFNAYIKNNLLLNQFYNNLSEEVSFVAKETPKIGEQYRYAKIMVRITIRIQPVTNTQDQWRLLQAL